MSANEGLNQLDIRSDGSTVDLYRSVERAIEEELAGRRKNVPESNMQRIKDVINTITHCKVTGGIMYVPNLSVNLCMYVRANCSSQDVRDAWFYARDSQIDIREIIREPQWDEVTGLPAFGDHSLYNFIEQTLGDKQPFEAWDEGALATLILSTLAL